MPRLNRCNSPAIRSATLGVQALASTFADGAFRELEILFTGHNQIGDAGVECVAFEKGALPAQTFPQQQPIGAMVAADGGGWRWAAGGSTLHLDPETVQS